MANGNQPTQQEEVVQKPFAQRLAELRAANQGGMVESLTQPQKFEAPTVQFQQETTTDQLIAEAKEEEGLLESFLKAPVRFAGGVLQQIPETGLNLVAGGIRTSAQIGEFLFPGAEQEAITAELEKAALETQRLGRVGTEFLTEQFGLEEGVATGVGEFATEAAPTLATAFATPALKVPGFLSKVPFVSKLVSGASRVPGGKLLGRVGKEVVRGVPATAVAELTTGRAPTSEALQTGAVFDAVIPETFRQFGNLFQATKKARSAAVQFFNSSITDDVIERVTNKPAVIQNIINQNTKTFASKVGKATVDSKNQFLKEGSELINEQFRSLAKFDPVRRNVVKLKDDVIGIMTKEAKLPVRKIKGARVPVFTRKGVEISNIFGKREQNALTRIVKQIDNLPNNSSVEQLVRLRNLIGDAQSEALVRGTTGASNLDRVLELMKGPIDDRLAKISDLFAAARKNKKVFEQQKKLLNQNIKPETIQNRILGNFQDVEFRKDVLKLLNVGEDVLETAKDVGAAKVFERALANGVSRIAKTFQLASAVAGVGIGLAGGGIPAGLLGSLGSIYVIRALSNPQTLLTALQKERFFTNELIKAGIDRNLVSALAKLLTASVEGREGDLGAQDFLRSR